jgi:DNA-binding transcriptional LysR family regulator
MIPQLSGVPAFVQVAEQLSFRDAARILGVTPTAVSKAIARLEERLGATLLHRTSRRVSLTPEGERYFRRCREALDLLAAAQDELDTSTEVVRGAVKISLSFVLGRLVVDSLHRLMSRYPQVRVELSLTDRDVSLVEDEVDVALRIGSLEDSALVARKLRQTRWTTVASPSYLARMPPIERPADLDAHRCLRFPRPGGGVAEWQFAPWAERAPIVYRSPSAVLIDQGDLLVHAAVSGLGVVQALDFMVEGHLARGELVEVLADHAATGPNVHALTLPGRVQVPRVRAIVDLLAEVLS